MLLDWILYFVKYPEAGRVKTRLARTVGPERAADLYRRCAEDNFRILALMEDAATRVMVVYDPPTAEAEIRSWLSHSAGYLAQEGPTLTERLANAFDAAFREGADSALALGSDTLGLDKHILQTAFRRLREADVVVGPARDGGYYLIGLSKPMPWIFEGIPWSTSRVLAAALERARQRHLTYHLLPVLDDLDQAESLRQYPLSTGGGR